MNIVDAIIILIIIGSALIGMKRGFTKEVISYLGFFFVVILAFVLKNPVSTFLYQNLPFFKFSGFFKGISTLNILIYEVIAFFIVVSILLILLRVIMFISSVFEKLLKLTIVLGIPSAILGFIVGIIDGITWVFITLYIVSLPVFNIDIVNESKLREPILNKTPILSSLVKDSVNATSEFIELKEEYQNDKNMLSHEFDLKSLDIFLKYKVVSVKSVDKLIEKDKLNIKNIDQVVDKYRKESL